MCFCAACHRGWLWLCWGGTEGDLATAHGGPGHSKSVSFGGDPSRLFKRVHYRLVNASAEGETLLTALNSLCTQSPSHSLTQTHTFSSPCAVFLLRCVSDSVRLPCVCFLCARHTRLWFCLLFMNFMGLAFAESNTVLQRLPISCIDLSALKVFFCAHACAAMTIRVWVCLCAQCLKCVKQIEGFFEDVFWSLEGDSGVCYCIFRTVCEGLLRERECVKF